MGLVGHKKASYFLGWLAWLNFNLPKLFGRLTIKVTKDLIDKVLLFLFVSLVIAKDFFKKLFILLNE